MKINCDKCGYLLGGIEVKENYGCSDCNPFWKPACKDCGHINGFHLDNCKSQIVQDAPTPPPQAPSIPPLPIQYCGICGRILTQTKLENTYIVKTFRKNGEPKMARMCIQCSVERVRIWRAKIRALKAMQEIKQAIKKVANKYK